MRARQWLLLCAALTAVAFTAVLFFKAEQTQIDVLKPMPKSGRVGTLMGQHPILRAGNPKNVGSLDDNGGAEAVSGDQEHKPHLDPSDDVTTRGKGDIRAGDSLKGGFVDKEHDKDPFLNVNPKSAEDQSSPLDAKPERPANSAPSQNDANVLGNRQEGTRGNGRDGHDLPSDVQLAHVQGGNDAESVHFVQRKWVDNIAGNTAVLVICYNRPKYLTRALEALAKYWPGGVESSTVDIPLFISQDGNDKGVQNAVDAFKKSHPSMDITHLHHPRDAQRGDDRLGYNKLARHFGWAFETVFTNSAIENILVVEDDLEISVDFFGYFFNLLPLLKSDPTLWTVSAWNDNGRRHLVKDPTKVLRSDFFPGLGWAMTRNLWQEYGPKEKWAPTGYWDDWMRADAQRKGRQVLRPEICRTFTFGEKGVSNGQFFHTHLSRIQLNTQAVDWDSFDGNSLLQPQYDRAYIAQVNNVAKQSVSKVLRLPTKSSDTPLQITEVAIEYNGIKEFQRFAKQLGIMDDEKSGVPRTGYRGVVEFWRDDLKVYVVPANLKEM